MTAPVIIATGASVAPGDVIFSAECRLLEHRDTSASVQTSAAADEDVSAAEGCYVRLVTSVQAGSTDCLQRQIIASRLGTVQWEGSTVRVFSRAQLARTTTKTAALPTRSADASATPAAAPAAIDAVGSAPSLGPRPGDTVHVRVVRVARLFVVGEIIAIQGTWCSTTGSTGLSAASSGSLSPTAFRGVLRVEDMRPFRPTKEQLQPPPPSASCQPGDVMLAEVISQSDARQYQLSTCAAHCGVVESYASNSTGGRVKLQVLPGRRDVMVDPLNGAVVPRWCPLVELTTSSADAKRRRI